MRSWLNQGNHILEDIFHNARFAGRFPDHDQLNAVFFITMPKRSPRFWPSSGPSHSATGIWHGKSQVVMLFS
jgi:hypothetical protein